MPFVWAKTTKYFDADAAGGNNMFYPQGILLSKKERLSVIWLAANYDPEKYKKIVPARDCEGMNIVRICDAIMNPSQTYALRLSAQLMLGTVRVYRTKTRICLELAEQMMLKLSVLLREASLRTHEMAVSNVKPDLITFASPSKSMIDYSLDAEYLDPEIIMNMNEGDFITINGTLIMSPMKDPTRRATPKSSAVGLASPLTVKNSKISFEEGMVSPNIPIQVPGEEEFGATSAAELLLDEELIDFHAVRVSLTERFNSSKLGPLLEEVEEELEHQTVPGGLKRKATEALDEDDLGAEPLKDYGPDEIPPMDVQTADPINNEQEIPIDTLCMDIPPEQTELTDKAERDKDVPMFQLEEDAEVEAEAENLIEQIKLLTGTAEEAVDRPFAGNELLEGAHPIDVLTIEEPPVLSSEQHTVIGEPRDWAQDLYTPAEAVILQPRPRNPRKKRKLLVDEKIVINSNDIRKNIATGASAWTSIPTVAGSSFPKSREMFSQAICTELTNPLLKDWWTYNAVTLEDPDLHKFMNEDEKEEEEVTPERLRADGETPMSKEIERAGSVSLPPLEHSAQSLPLINQSTLSEDATLLRSMEKDIDLSRGETPLPEATDDGHRLSGILPLEQDMEIDLDLNPVLEPIEEIAPDDLLVTDNQMPTASNAEPSMKATNAANIADVPDDVSVHHDPPRGTSIPDIDSLADEEVEPENAPKLEKFKKRLAKAVRHSEITSFWDLYPVEKTRRRDAALAFYSSLTMHKTGILKLKQSSVWGEVIIIRGENAQ